MTLRLTNRSGVILAIAAFAAFALPSQTEAKSGNGPRAHSSFFLRNDDVVVFYGDSITALNRSTWPQHPVRPNYTYCVDIVSWVESQMPNNRISFYDMGVPGDTAEGDKWPDGGPANMSNPPNLGIDQRLAAVEALHPTVVTVNLGMNDGEYVDCDPADGGYNAVLYQTYVSGMSHIIDTLLSWSRKTGSPLHIVVISPGLFDNAERASAGWSFPWKETPAANYNKTLIAFGAWEQSYVAQLKNPSVTFIDINRPMQLANSQLPAGQSLTQEGVHPTEQGYEVMAAEILSSWDARATAKPGNEAVWPLFNGGSAYDICPEMKRVGVGADPADQAQETQTVISIRARFLAQYDAIMSSKPIPDWANAEPSVK